MNTAVARRLASGDRVVWISKDNYQPSGPGTITRTARATPINPKYSGAVLRLFPPAPNTWRRKILPLGQFRPAPRLSVSPIHIA